ncbi:helix-turn-helix domain-containing protein [Aliamphritea hakodatensis]|uniref:helix-turn-helix domain-containing protein n=1 Tax=Aliamphritea hakodatensis TaxID=2895352 RepID=UPI0022FD9EB2|nr:AraC family transcriptional regulator [Aliamphritea hakodatensis]
MQLTDANLSLSLVRSYWQKADLDWAYPSYQRPYNWLIYTRSGRGYVELEGRRLKLLPGSMVVVPLNRECHYHCTEPMEIGACAFTLQMSPGVDVFDLYRVPDNPVAVTDEQLFRDVIEAEQKPGGTLLAMGAVLRLLAPVLDVAATRGESGQDEVRMQKVLSYIDRHLTHLDMTDLASQLGFSDGHFSRWFNNVMGVSPKRYVIQKRVEAATRLLLFGGQNIEAVARHCGYEDALYFSRIFKKYTGLSPREYRKIKQFDLGSQ